MQEREAHIMRGSLNLDLPTNSQPRNFVTGSSIMPPPRRQRRRGRRQRNAQKTPSPSSVDRGWLSVRRRQFKREGGRWGAEDGDGAVPLGDDALLLVFSGLSDSRDLVCCATTCRRWRRLVSSNPIYICRRAPPPCDRFIRRLAIGFFCRFQSQYDDGHFVPFVASPSSSSLSLGGLVDGGLLDSSRVVASRNGRVVLDLRRTKTGCTLRLCVCNPMTGDVDFLPPLVGKDRPGPYACTLLTAADGLHLYNGRLTGGWSTTPSSSYRVLLVYNHRGYSALRCYSSDGGGIWGPEVEVMGARIRRMRQLGLKAHASLVRGGSVCWPGLSLAVNLLTLKTTNPTYTVQGSCTPQHSKIFVANEVDRLLGVMPDDRLCVVESKGDSICAYVVGYADIVRNGGTSGRKALLWTLKPAQVAPGARAVRLRWFCEMSGVVLFTARSGLTTYLYTVDVETKQVGRVAGGEWSGYSDDINVCGYEMDRVAMLAELG